VGDFKSATRPYTERRHRQPARRPCQRIIQFRGALSLYPRRCLTKIRSGPRLQDPASADVSTLYLFATVDGGRSWTSVNPPVTTGGRGELLGGDAPRLAVIDQRNWLLLTDRLRVTHDGGLTWTLVPTAQDLGDVVRLEFSTIDAGWAYSERTTCVAKANCSTTTRLLRTSDGGRTWTAINVP
jgi:photosystem II stability/assembly factor-like uncharacterized protein